jgi:hypothetical protein
MKPEISRQIFEKFLMHQISLKYVQWEPSCSMQTDRHEKLIVACHTFANAPKEQLLRGERYVFCSHRPEDLQKE